MIPVFDKKTDMGKALLSTLELVFPRAVQGQGWKSLFQIYRIYQVSGPLVHTVLSVFVLSIIV
jgi:hypothetical protein